MEETTTITTEIKRRSLTKPRIGHSMRRAAEICASIYLEGAPSRWAIASRVYYPNPSTYYGYPVVDRAITAGLIVPKMDAKTGKTRYYSNSGNIH